MAEADPGNSKQSNAVLNEIIKDFISFADSERKRPIEIIKKVNTNLCKKARFSNENGQCFGFFSSWKMP